MPGRGGPAGHASATSPPTRRPPHPSLFSGMDRGVGRSLRALWPRKPASQCVQLYRGRLLGRVRRGGGGTGGGGDGRAGGGGRQPGRVGCRAALAGGRALSMTQRGVLARGRMPVWWCTPQQQAPQTRHCLALPAAVPSTRGATWPSVMAPQSEQTFTGCQDEAMQPLSCGMVVHMYGLPQGRAKVPACCPHLVPALSKRVADVSALAPLSCSQAQRQRIPPIQLPAWG